MKKLLNLIFNQRGNVLVLVAVSMTMLAGFTALVVDGGSLFLEKSKLQKSLDAAVLAGAQELLNSQAAAKTAAIEIAGKNNLNLSEADITTGDDFIEVSKTVNKNLTLAAVLGFPNSDVAAVARAEIGGTLLKREGIVPIGIEFREFSSESPFTMNFEPGNPENPSESGNFGFLNIGGTGGNVLKENIINGAEMEVSEEMYAWTKTGLSWGNVQAGFQARIDADKEKDYCQNYDTADDSCSRVIIVPLVETYADAEGKTLVKIIGFASFWISSNKITPHKVEGQFIDIVTFGEFGEGEDTGVYGVRLSK